MYWTIIISNMVYWTIIISNMVYWKKNVNKFLVFHDLLFTPKEWANDIHGTN